MPSEEDKYESIEEVRSPLYPGSAPMLNRDREDVLELPVKLSEKSRNLLEEIVKRTEAGPAAKSGHGIAEDDAD
jgi:hypothetical protein